MTAFTNNSAKKRKFAIFDKISKKISFVLLVAIVITLSITGAFIYTYSKDLLTQNIEENLEAKSMSMAKEINALFKEKGTIVKQFATNQELVNFIKTANNRDAVAGNPYSKSLYKTMDAIRDTDQQAAMTWVASVPGNFLIGSNKVLSNPDYNNQDRPWFKPALEAPDVFYSQPYQDQIFNKVIMSVMTKVKDGNDVIGIVALDIFIDAMPDILKSYKIGEDGYSFLLAADGTIIYHPEQDLILKKMQDTDGDLAAVAQKMVSGEEGLERIHQDGQEKFIHYSSIPSAGWSVATVLPVNSATESLGTLGRLMFVSFGISLVILVAIVFILITYLLRDIPRISSVINELAQGNLSLRLKPRSRDELGQVAHNMNEALDKLTVMISNVHENTELLAAASEELMATSDESVRATSHISSLIEANVEGGKTQLQSTEQTAKAMEEMAAGIQRIAEATSSVSETSLSTFKEVDNGNQVIVQAIKQMQYTRESVGQTAKELTHLEEYSNKIGDIVTLIKEISNQTQLLSLNASIEAARAGEQGRGFGVVASEVKKLAEESTASSEQISNLVKDVQIMVQTAVQRMTKGVMDVEQAESTMNQAGAVFTKIMEMNGSVSNEIFEISTAAEQISAGTEEVSASMSEVASICKETFNNSRSISKSADHQFNAFGEIAAASEKLSEMAQQLFDYSKQFKVK